MEVNKEFPNRSGVWTIGVIEGAPIVAEMTAYDKSGNIITDRIGQAGR